MPITATHWIRSAEEFLVQAREVRATYPGVAAILDEAGAEAALRAIPAASHDPCPKVDGVHQLWNTLVAQRIADVPPTTKAVQAMRIALADLDRGREAALTCGPAAGSTKDTGAAARHVVDHVCAELGLAVRLAPTTEPDDAPSLV